MEKFGELQYYDDSVSLNFEINTHTTLMSYKLILLDFMETFCVADIITVQPQEEE
jgi:hypothetical protein